MNFWFLAAGALLAAAFFVHVFSGNRFYSAARPDAGLDSDPDTDTCPESAACSGASARPARSVHPASRPEAYEAWLMGRCGVQMISVDLFLAAVFLLLLGFGVLPRNFWFEVFLLSVFGGWGIFWLVSLACEGAGRNHYGRLCHWVLFFVLGGLMLGGILG